MNKTKHSNCLVEALNTKIRSLSTCQAAVKYIIHFRLSCLYNI